MIMLSSKERLLRCIRHEEIDRVPISTYELVGWNRNAWENNDHSYKKVMDVIRANTDCIYMLNPIFSNSFEFETEKWKEGQSIYTKSIYKSQNGDLTTIHRDDEGLYTTWRIKHMLKEIEDIDKYLSLPYNPPKIDMTHFNCEKEFLGDKGLMMITIEDPICVAAELFEMSDFLIYAMIEPQKIKFFLDAIHERQMYILKDLLKNNVKDVIFRIVGPEYGTPPYMSPESYYNFVTCYLINICKEIVEAGGLPRIHSHGKIAKVIDQFAMTDAVAIDPIEPIPDGDISLGEIKKKYGDKFCLFGNIELKELEHSDKKRIDDLVKTAMEEGKNGSGFVIMPTAAPINTPLSKKTEANYLQYIESALKYGKY